MLFFYLYKTSIKNFNIQNINYLQIFMLYNIFLYISHILKF